jgi:exosortase/archaeosortase family protein
MNRMIIRIGVKAFLLYVLWLLFFKGLNFVIPAYSDALVNFDDFVRYLIMKPSQVITHWITGLNIGLHHDAFTIANRKFLIVNNECLAIKLIFIFCIPVIVLPGALWKNKLWFIPSGIILIHMMNIVRIAGLCLTVIYTDYFNFMHSFVFRLMLYLTVIVLWLIWMKYFIDTKGIAAALKKETTST